MSGFKLIPLRERALTLAVAPDSLTGETVWLPSPNLQHRLEATLVCRAVMEELVSEAFGECVKRRRMKTEDGVRPSPHIGPQSGHLTPLESHILCNGLVPDKIGKVEGRHAEAHMVTANKEGCTHVEGATGRAACGCTLM